MSAGSTEASLQPLDVGTQMFMRAVSGNDAPESSRAGPCTWASRGAAPGAAGGAPGAGSSSERGVPAAGARVVALRV